MDKVKERLLQFAKSQKLAMMVFYKKTTIASSNFSEKGSESAMSTDKIIHILNVYPELSPDWMLLEKGEMLRKNNAKNVPVAASPRQSTANGDAYVPHSAEILALIASQQQSIADLTETIKNLSSKI